MLLHSLNSCLVERDESAEVGDEGVWEVDVWGAGAEGLVASDPSDPWRGDEGEEACC